MTTAIEIPAPHADRVAATDWAAVKTTIDAHGCAPTGRLLTVAECREIAAMYEDDHRFRSTVNMARHRFGSGEYRYFRYPFPDPLPELRAALYERLLPIARDYLTGKSGFAMNNRPNATTSATPAASIPSPSAWLVATTGS